MTTRKKTREWVKLGLDSDKTQKHSKRRREQWRKYDATPERIAKKAQWYQENKEQIKEKKRLRVRLPEYKLRNTAWRMKRYHEDPVYRAKDILRRQLWWFCKNRNGNKEGRTHELLGYSSKELCEHLESLFKDGMTWDNQGKWHIDHRIPQSHFTNIDQLKECFALDNLKPEWGDWNMSKGNKFIG